MHLKIHAALVSDVIESAKVSYTMSLQEGFVIHDVSNVLVVFLAPFHDFSKDRSSPRGGGAINSLEQLLGGSV